MVQVPIPINTPVYKGIDGVQLIDNNSLLIDGYMARIPGESEMASIKRPGLLSFTTIGSTSAAIDGIFWWSNREILIVVCNGRVYKVTYPASVATVTDITGVTLTASVRPSFTTDGTYLFIATGGRIVYTDGSTTTAYISDSDAPTQVSHIGFIDGYIVAQNQDNKFYWSDLNSSLSWNALSFAQPVAYPDKLLGLKTFNREIYLFGENSVEIWENDGTTPFSRVPGGSIETGCIAPHSVVGTEEGLFWLNDKKHFIFFSGRSPQIFSTPYDTEISDYSDVSDCMGDRIEIDGKPFLIFHFPQANTTLSYNLEDKNWSKFSYWNSIDATYSRWLGNNYTFIRNWNLHIIGSRATNTLFSMKRTYYDDNGDDIRFCRQTGHISYGTTKEKISDELRLRVKAGAVDLTNNPIIMIRWKKDNRDWSQEHYISLGDIGEYNIVRRILRTGRYRTRQYEFCHTDHSPMIFLDGQEEISITR